MDYGEPMQKQSDNDDLKSSSYEKCRKKTWWSPFYFKVVSFSLATTLKQGCFSEKLLYRTPVNNCFCW